MIIIYLSSLICDRTGGADPTTPTLVGPKILLVMVIALYFQRFGRTNNCQIEVRFKWSDQSCTPSAALVCLIIIHLSSLRICGFLSDTLNAPGTSREDTVRMQMDKLNSFPALAFELFSSIATALDL